MKMHIFTDVLMRVCMRVKMYLVDPPCVQRCIPTRISSNEGQMGGR